MALNQCNTSITSENKNLHKEIGFCVLAMQISPIVNTFCSLYLMQSLFQKCVFFWPEHSDAFFLLSHKVNSSSYCGLPTPVILVISLFPNMWKTKLVLSTCTLSVQHVAAVI